MDQSMHEYQDEMKYGADYKWIPAASVRSGVSVEAAPNLICHTVQIVNVCFAGTRQGYALVDAGMPGSADKIIAAAEEHFGADTRPNAIILTHGHFDHVGAVIELVDYWDVPVYAHEKEIPYLTNKKQYPDADPSSSSGLIAKLSPLFPRDPIDLGGHVHPLPADGSVPGLPQFQWIHTPGHTPGHVSLFRAEDRALIAGDAFVTVKQEHLYKVLTQKAEISGPPKYFTPDWKAAKQSAAKLEALKPLAAVTGHGMPMKGKLLQESLKKLVHHFDQMAVQKQGKYVLH